MRPESRTHEDIRENLVRIGWRSCEGYKEHQLIEDYLLKDILRDQIKLINREVLESYSLEREQIDKLTEEAINRLMNAKNTIEILSLIKDGTILELDRGRRGSISFKVRFIDFENPEKNKFCFIHEAKFRGSPENSKPDFTLFINGIPVVIIEAKREFPEGEEETHKEALRQIERYERDSPDLFRFVQLGVIVAEEDFYLPVYPNPDGEQRPKRKLNKWNNIWELLTPGTLLDFIENFVFFASDRAGRSFKIVPRYKQYVAVSKAFKRIEEYLDGGGEKDRGLIWHWQGAGKTYEIIFLSEKFCRKYEKRNPVVFIVVDRVDLEEQFDEDIRSLKGVKFLSDYEKVEKVEKLKEILRRIKESEENPAVSSKGVYLVMAHKFRRDVALEIQEIGAIQKKEILILRDEAHRTEGGKSILASVRKFVLPRALKFGFTGTPVHRRENSTFREYAYPQEKEFYLDKYFVEDSIRDGYTLPLLWRVAVSEGVSLNLTEEEVKRLVREYFVDRDFDEKEEIPEVSETEIREKLPFSDLLKAEDLIKKASLYIAQKVKEDTENFKFKAMVVAQDRISAIKFKRYLDRYLSETYPDYTPEWVQVVITHEHNDPDEIRLFKKEMEERYGKSIEVLNKEWRENFVDKDLPRILVVNRKLLTGFDAPILKVIYLAQLMKDVLLLQTCARANRPFPGKRNGLIVDLCGVLIENYKKALERYNIYEDREISKDLLKNLFIDSSKLWKEFLEKLDRFKKLFKEVTGTEWEDYVRTISEGSSAEARELFSEVVNRIITTNRGFYILLPILKELVDMYEAVGAYPEKVSYHELYREFLILRAGISKKLKPKTPLPKDLKEELLSRLEFKEIKDIDDFVLDEERIEKLRRSGKLHVVVADFLFPLISMLEDKKDPLHKAIYKRLEDLKQRYLRRKLDAQMLIEEIEVAVKELKNYEKARKSLNPEDLIIRNIAYYVKKNGGDLKVTEGLRKIIAELLSEKLITESAKEKLKEELIISLEMDPSYLAENLDLIIEEIILPMIKELRYERRS